MEESKVRIGVLGGTFDPIHNGHILVAEEVISRLNLEQVIFVPAGRPWLKEGNVITAVEHRVAMVRLAIGDNPAFKLSLVEVSRPGPSLSVDTVAELQAQLGKDVELFFIIGCDNLTQLPRWKEPARLIKMCRLVVVPRPGYVLPDLSALEVCIPGLSRSLILLDKPEVDIDATGIRQRIAQGLPVNHLVPAAVDEYIRRHRLYITR
ncbi:MAG: nicotinate-nucleotide adenylyltransferase [Chloroflexi bacterium]|nr:nicotinate-nucleotide adenylyltransferase [Chloroflexota bacterium]